MDETISEASSWDAGMRYTFLTPQTRESDGDDPVVWVSCMPKNVKDFFDTSKRYLGKMTRRIAYKKPQSLRSLLF